MEDMADPGRFSFAGADKVDTLEVLAFAAGRLEEPCPLRIGLLKLHERLMMSFPWTTRLSVDFLRSLVIIWSGVSR